MPAQCSGICCSYLNISYQTSRILSRFSIMKMPAPCIATQPPIKGRSQHWHQHSCAKAAPFLFQGHVCSQGGKASLPSPSMMTPGWGAANAQPAQYTQWNWRLTQQRRKGGFIFSQANYHIKSTLQIAAMKRERHSKFGFLHQSITYCILAGHSTMQTRLHCAHCSDTAAFLLPQLQRNRTRTCSFLSFSH